MLDVEAPQSHPDLADAIRLAKDNAIRLAISNPCFELWLVLHLKDQSASLTSAEACALRQRLDGSQGKELDPGRYLPRIDDAIKRAQALDRTHERNGASLPQNNPSSGMHLVIEVMRG